MPSNILEQLLKSKGSMGLDFADTKALNMDALKAILQVPAYKDYVGNAVPIPLPLQFNSANPGNAADANQMLFRLQPQRNLPEQPRDFAPMPDVPAGFQQYHTAKEVTPATLDALAASGGRTGMVGNLLHHALGSVLNEKIKANTDKNVLAERSDAIDALEKQRKDLTPQQFNMEMMKLGGDVGQAGQQSYIQNNKPKSERNPWVGGLPAGAVDALGKAIDQPDLYRQNYEYDNEGQPKPVGAPYRAFQPQQLSKYITLTPEQKAASNLPTEGVYQLDTKNNKVSQVHLPPKPSQDQLASQGYANQMNMAEQNAAGLFEKGFNPQNMSPAIFGSYTLAQHDSPVIGYVGNKALGNFDPNAQNYLNIVAEWGMAVKRQESGAAVSKVEGLDYARNYWPMPGDHKDSIATKNAARQQKNTDASFRAQGVLEHPSSTQTQTPTPTSQIVDTPRGPKQSYDPVKAAEELSRRGIRQ